MGIFLLTFNPFSAAFSRLRAFILCLKNFRKLWRGDNIEDPDDWRDYNERLLRYNITTAFAEAMFEAAPQVIIQLYAINVQEEPVKIVQIISLALSFLSLARAFTAVEELCDGSLFDLFIPCGDRNSAINMKHKIIFFITHLFLVSSRLFAIVYFTISYKWWIIGVLMFHFGVIMIVDHLWFNRFLIYKYLCCSFPGLVVNLIVFCIYWIRDDIVFSFSRFDTHKKQHQLLILWLSNVLFVLENLVMIRMFHYSEHSNAWCSLPVTICVCSFSVIGAIMRVAHKHFLKQRPRTNDDPSVTESFESCYFNNLSLSTNVYLCYETSV